ncbi:50S ribosomal protein L4 [Candidatus Pacearchaeota archaeon]|nr:50S ribosomal protein L4 [Candidatus Pacearchaeota archaeon]
MKTKVLDISGRKTKEISTKLFEEPIREDIICKVFESEKMRHPNSPKYRAGMDRSASGLQRKRRHVWKSDRGKGLSRIPRKIFWRRGTQFSWEGTIIPSAKGGRRAHPPKGSLNLKKINKKEIKKALLSAISYSSSKRELKKKYQTLKDQKIDVDLPIIVEDKILSLKTKEVFEALQKILGELYSVSISKKSVRPGIGKLRGRKYKKNAGAIIVTGKNEEMKNKGIDTVSSNKLIVSDIANQGPRITIYTENAIKELEEALLK